MQQYRAQILRTLVGACADGRLEPGELAARSEAAQQASSLPALAVLIADIPGPGLAAVAAPCRRARRLVLPGRWRLRALAARAAVAAVLSEVVLDLRRSAVTSFETQITAVALAGEVRIVVPAGFRVDTGGGVTVFGRTSVAAPPGRASALAPVIRLRSVAVLGNVLLSHVPPAL